MNKTTKASKKKVTKKKVAPKKKTVTKKVPTTQKKSTVKKKTVRKKRKPNYLNNADLLAEAIKSKEQGKMTDKLAHMLMTLVARYGKKGNFANYTYNDDMQGYALMMLAKTWNSFKPEKSTNAFAFFTQCVKHSFIQFLNQERRQRDIRDEVLVNKGLTPSYTFTSAYEEQQKTKNAEARSFAHDEQDFEENERLRKELEKNRKQARDDILEF